MKDTFFVMIPKERREEDPSYLAVIDIETLLMPGCEALRSDPKKEQVDRTVKTSLGEMMKMFLAGNYNHNQEVMDESLSYAKGSIQNIRRKGNNREFIICNNDGD